MISVNHTNLPFSQIKIDFYKTEMAEIFGYLLGEFAYKQYSHLALWVETSDAVLVTGLDDLLSAANKLGLPDLD